MKRTKQEKEKDRIIGQRLTDIRKKLDITQGLIAEVMGVAPNTVGSYERGGSIKKEYMDRFVKHFKIDENYFNTDSTIDKQPLSSLPTEDHFDINEYKLSDLKRLASVVEDMKTMNKELIHQTTTLIETNARQANSIELHAKSANTISHTLDNAVEMNKKYMEKDLNIENSIAEREERLISKITELFMTMSRGSVLGEEAERPTG